MVSLLLLLAVIFWGLSFIGTKMALAYLTPVEIIAVRLLLGLPVMAIIMKWRRLKLKIERADIIVIIIASLILGFHFVIQAFGLIYTSATNTAWLIATIPIFVAISSRIFLKEVLDRKRIVGILIATSGVLLLVSRGRLGSLDWLESVGDWIILGSCLTWTAYTIITRNLTRRQNPLSLTVIFLIIPTVLLVAYTAMNTPVSKFAALPVSIILVLAGLGIFCLGLAHWFWLEGLAGKGAIRTGVFLYIEPVITTLAAMPILGESLSLAGLGGVVLILIGVYMVERRPVMSVN